MSCAVRRAPPDEPLFSGRLSLERAAGCCSRLRSSPRSSWSRTCGDAGSEVRALAFFSLVTCHRRLIFVNRTFSASIPTRAAPAEPRAHARARGRDRDARADARLAVRERRCSGSGPCMRTISRSRLEPESWY